MLLLQLTLRPQQVATATQAGVRGRHEHQGCRGADEGLVSVRLHLQSKKYSVILMLLMKLSLQLNEIKPDEMLINFTN